MLYVNTDDKCMTHAVIVFCCLIVIGYVDPRCCQVFSFPAITMFLTFYMQSLCWFYDSQWLYGLVRVDFILVNLWEKSGLLPRLKKRSDFITY